jgi:hypothetical protein
LSSSKSDIDIFLVDSASFDAVIGSYLSPPTIDACCCGRGDNIGCGCGCGGCGCGG